MVMFNAENLHLLNYFPIALILIFFFIYVNHVRQHLLFYLILCGILFPVLLHVHLLPPPTPPPLSSFVLLFPLSTLSLDYSKPFSLHYNSFCNCCHNNRMMYSTEPTNHPSTPIYPPLVDCNEYSYLIPLL